MERKITKLLSFKLSGKFAHFRKFYTNASSLSYSIPPRTVITGMLASILEIPRNEYYDLFNIDEFCISVSVKNPAKKSTQSMNYLHDKYYKLLTSGKGKVQHSQCKLELLIGKENHNIEYIIDIGAVKEDSVKILNKVYKRIQAGNYGYGIYLGQRQFKADISDIDLFGGDEITYIKESDILNSICIEDNFIDCEIENGDDLLLVSEQMPVQMEKVIDKKNKIEIINRKSTIVKRVIFETNGNIIKGHFKNCYKVDERVISFYEG